MARGSASVGSQREGQRAETPIFTRDFVLVCLTGFATAMAMQFLLPTLPLYVKELGGQDTDIGLLLGAYSLSALGSRFAIGPILDLHGRRWPLVGGILLYLAAVLLYSVANTVPSLILLRLFHGIGFGIVTTTGATLVADLAPPSRRGEAMGYYSNVQCIAMALGPGIALGLIGASGFPVSGFALLFLVCDGVAVIQLLLALQVREPLRPLADTSTSPRRLSVATVFSRSALPIAIAMMLGSCAQGAVLGFASIYLSTENTQNVPVFFLFYATVMAISRPLLGRLADRVDRRRVAIPLMLLCACGVSILAIGPSLPVAMVAAVVFGVGYGALNPTLLALVVDVVKPQERGAALGTFMASIDVGIGFGSMSLGLVAQAHGYPAVFLTAGAVGFCGLIYFVAYLRLSPRPRNQGQRA